MKIQHCCPNEQQEDIRFIASVFIIGVSSSIPSGGERTVGNTLLDGEHTEIPQGLNPNTSKFWMTYFSDFGPKKARDQPARDESKSTPNWHKDTEWLCVPFQTFQRMQKDNILYCGRVSNFPIEEILALKVIGNWYLNLQDIVEQDVILVATFPGVQFDDLNMKEQEAVQYIERKNNYTKPSLVSSLVSYLLTSPPPPPPSALVMTPDVLECLCDLPVCQILYLINGGLFKRFSSDEIQKLLEALIKKEASACVIESLFTVLLEDLSRYFDNDRDRDLGAKVDLKQFVTIIIDSGKFVFLFQLLNDLFIIKDGDSHYDSLELDEDLSKSYLTVVDLFRKVLMEDIDLCIRTIEDLKRYGNDTLLYWHLKQHKRIFMTLHNFLVLSSAEGSIGWSPKKNPYQEKIGDKTLWKLCKLKPLISKHKHKQ
eukprot:GHVH01014515.1.p1 GENE.GHVH01014515.1~~GHVH01014515.1.p1  ORF type:complete len:426 (-),score=62.20 GHVH01014515.1:76-1353(-)